MKEERTKSSYIFKENDKEIIHNSKQDMEEDNWWTEANWDCSVFASVRQSTAQTIVGQFEFRSISRHDYSAIRHFWLTYISVWQTYLYVRKNSGNLSIISFELYFRFKFTLEILFEQLPT